MAFVLVALPGGAAAEPNRATAVLRENAPHLTILRDGGSATHPDGGGNSTLSDALGFPAEPGRVRNYTLVISATEPLPEVSLEVQTSPVGDWGDPWAFPYGPDNLPRLSDWTWWVRTASGVNDTSNWSVDPDGVHLDRNVTWANGSFEIFGVSDPTVVVNLTSNSTAGTQAVGTGFVLNAPGYANSIPSSPTYGQLAGGVHPALVRITLGIPGALAGWNLLTGQPEFEFGRFDKEMAFVQSIGAQVLLSFPAGTWGDGNTLPPGTPLNLTAPMSYDGTTGFFPTPAAMYAIVRGVANHTFASNEPIEYWSIGNEVPAYSAAETGAFAGLVDASIAALAPLDPSARVGADDMMSPTYLSEFAARAPAVGFLSFHWYPAAVCSTAEGAYCAPAPGSGGTPTPALFAADGFEGHYGLVAPPAAVAIWRNATGHTLPVVLSETNLAASGGIGTSSQSFGTDPRQQTLVGAAWLGALLQSASEENVSAITYFGLTSATNFSAPVTEAYGGFGFGLTNESPSGNTTEFAPYWAMTLWGRYLPDGAPGVVLNDSDPTAVSAYAVRNGSAIDVALVDRGATDASVRILGPASWTFRASFTLDDRSYVERYDPATNVTSVLQSGLEANGPSTNTTLTLDGYGVAVVVLGPPEGPTPGGPGTGGGISALGEAPDTTVFAVIAGVGLAVGIAAAIWSTHRRPPKFSATRSQPLDGD